MGALAAGHAVSAGDAQSVAPAGRTYVNARKVARNDEHRVAIQFSAAFITSTGSNRWLRGRVLKRVVSVCGLQRLVVRLRRRFGRIGRHADRRAQAAGVRGVNAPPWFEELKARVPSK
jgi:hypothetical protein